MRKGDNCCVEDRQERLMFLLNNPLRRLITRPRKFVSQYVRGGSIVADLGCGPGFFAIPMAEVVGAEGKVYAIDSDEKSIKRLRSVSAKLGLQNIEASMESAAHLDSIGDHSLDFILANLVLCCMTDHTGPIGEIKRTLRRDGSAYLSVIRVRRSKDPRNVTQDQWRSILGGFRITTERTGLFTRSAVVALRP